jgi:cysteine desulfurase/selenocysteine lyase
LIAGVLYAKEHLLQDSLPVLYGGDMIAEGQVHVDEVRYNELPWKYAAGTPNTLGLIVSAQGLRLLADLVGDEERACYFTTNEPLPHEVVEQTMQRIGEHTSALTAYALDRLRSIKGLTVYGPPPGAPRSPLVAFNVAGWHPTAIAEGLNRAHVESRAGCHCATLAHHDLGLDPPGSCRLSFAVYNTVDEVDAAVDALEWVVSGARV